MWSLEPRSCTVAAPRKEGITPSTRLPSHVRTVMAAITQVLPNVLLREKAIREVTSVQVSGRAISSPRGSSSGRTCSIGPLEIWRTVFWK